MWANGKQRRKESGVAKQIRSLVNDNVPRGMVLADAYFYDSQFCEGLKSL